MTIDDPAQPQLVLDFLRLFFAVAQALHTRATAARRSRKISVPVGYKFSPTDGDLVNHHLKRKIMNLPEEHDLIPEYYHYEAEPWDLINKYNESSDGESCDETCFFFSINRTSKRTNRTTPKGYWHETSGKMSIVGSDGVEYIMKYFTYYIGQRRKKGETTAWRMREYTDPSQKELALCKIYNDIDGQKTKKKDGCSSESRTPEAYANIAMEAPTPISVNMRDDNLVSPQLAPRPLDESQVSTSLSDFNMMTYDVNSTSHQQLPMYTEERYLPSGNAYAIQFLDFNNSRLYDPSDFNLMKDGLIDHHPQQLMHTEEEPPLAQNAFADKISDSNNPRQQLTHNKEGSPLPQSASADQSLNFSYPYNAPDDEFNKDLLYPHNVIPNTSDVPHSKRRHMAEGTSLEASQQPPVKKLRSPITQSENLELTPSNCGDSLQHRQMDEEIRNLPSTNSSPFNSSIYFTQRNNVLIGYGSEEVNSQDFLALPSDWSDWISIDDIPITNGTNIEEHSNESTICPSSSNFSTFDKVDMSEPPGIEMHEAQQPIQQQALPDVFPAPESPIQSFNTTPFSANGYAYHIPEEFIDDDDDHHQNLWNSA